MAPRLETMLKAKDQSKPFWIIKNLPRRGLIAGNYQLINSSDSKDLIEAIEIEKPKLFTSNFNPEPNIIASDKVDEDVIQLLRISLNKHHLNLKSHWEDSLPIYPTSPVENQQINLN